ncbi:DUF4139 domain-containing protein [Roseicyclus mahoneyensis]|uniref:Uncharacterized protein (TIGR02231 family) n=1 Tax=Roseicyclus mahoneyensis TaxID=164332 RepID=A0A316GI39_9RHOB|nr:DUF4139 domain-containing protein [Roseicyclus mahoneyensis]PWK59831.1 uncharacterized protein (TIGR02231 family) [Roseicyclus mahoneyensis]
MRFALSLTAALMTSTAALADDIVIRADIAEATVFLSGAEITRRGRVSVPPGTHRLLIAMPDAAQAERIEVSGPEGLTLGAPQQLSGHVIAEGALDDPQQAAARAAVEGARDAVQQAQDDLTAADAGLRALEAQLSYLSALARGGPEGATMPTDPATLPQLLATLGAETARVQAETLAAQIARRDLAEALTDRQADLAAATADLARLRPLGAAIDVIEIAVISPTETEAEITVDYLSYGAGWEPGYEIHLDSESGALTVERFIAVYTSGAARWQDVAMTFSTSEPSRQRQPSGVFPTPARIAEPAPPINAGIGALAQNEARFADALPTPVMEPAMVATLATPQTEGLSLNYAYTSPVSIGPSGQAMLPFDTLALETETEARAIPRSDQTAFLIAMGRNDTGEPILPGYTAFFRDGALIGEDMIGLIADGAEFEMAFGPLDHLRLIWIDRSLAEGNRGLFTSSTTQERSISFGVENTSGSAEQVRLIYATPFAEQEDLELDLTLSPASDARDIDDLRGVHAWDLTVAPRETVLVDMQVRLAWPEGQILTWWP